MEIAKSPFSNFVHCIEIFGSFFELSIIENSEAVFYLLAHVVDTLGRWSWSRAFGEEETFHFFDVLIIKLRKWEIEANERKKDVMELVWTLNSNCAVVVTIAARWPDLRVSLLSFWFVYKLINQCGITAVSLSGTQTKSVVGTLLVWFMNGHVCIYLMPRVNFSFWLDSRDYYTIYCLSKCCLIAARLPFKHLAWSGVAELLDINFLGTKYRNPRDA